MWPIEKRRQARLSVTNGAIASLWPEASVTGPIIDINTDGLSFSYSGLEDRTTGSTHLTVLLADGTFEERALPFKAMSDMPLANGCSGGAAKRRCGLMFGSLDDKQKAAIRCFIHTCAETTAQCSGPWIPFRIRDLRA